MSLSCARLSLLRRKKPPKRGKPLTEQGKASKRSKSAVRARVEDVFGVQTTDMGGTLMRIVDLVRAKAKIGKKNLA